MDKSILEVVHESAKGLNNAGLLDAKTMRELDALCSPVVNEYSPDRFGIKTRQLELLLFTLALIVLIKVLF